MPKQIRFLTEICPEDFGLSTGGALPDGRFRPVSLCAEATRESASVFGAVRALSVADQRAALKGLAHLVKLAHMGKPFNQLVDEKAVHEAFEPFYCKVTKRKETVWRYRHGDIRILFYYASGKVVLLTDVLAKRKDKLSEKEQNKAKQAVMDFLEASQSEGGIQWVE